MKGKSGLIIAIALAIMLCILIFIGWVLLSLQHSFELSKPPNRVQSWDLQHTQRLINIYNPIDTNLMEYYGFIGNDIDEYQPTIFTIPQDNAVQPFGEDSTIEQIEVVYGEEFLYATDAVERDYYFSQPRMKLSLVTSGGAINDYYYTTDGIYTGNPDEKVRMRDYETETFLRPYVDAVLDIVGKNEIPNTGGNDFLIQDGTLMEYRGESSDVVIPNNVTTIADFAFYADNLTSVLIPDSVTTIGEAAFCYNNISSIVIPNSVTELGYDCFNYSGLTKVTLSQSIDWIPFCAFANNDFDTVVIPSSIKSIAGDAFENSKVGIFYVDESIPEGAPWGAKGRWILPPNIEKTA